MDFANIALYLPLLQHLKCIFLPARLLYPNGQWRGELHAAHVLFQISYLSLPFDICMPSGFQGQ